MGQLPRLFLSETIELHALDCAARRLSPRTIDVYRRDLAILVRYIGDIPLDAVTDTDLRTFQVTLVRDGFSAIYQHQIMRCVRAFFNYCVAEGLLPQTPLRNLRMPKVEQKVLEALSEGEVTLVVKACQTLRDKALVLTLASSGLRASEATALCIADVEVASGMIRVRYGKGGKARLTYMDAASRKAVRLYLLTRKGAKPTHPLFASTQRRNSPLNGQSLAHLMMRLQQASGVHVTAHGLRRTFALRALRAGVNIHVLARLMGHADIGILRQYLPLSEHDLTDAYQKAFP